MMLFYKVCIGLFKCLKKLVMKKVILLIVVFITPLLYSQTNDDSYSKGKKDKKEKFTYNSDGLNSNNVYISVKNVKKSDLYLKALDWIEENYKDSNKVIKQKEEKNKKIRFKGSASNAICFGF